MRSFLQSIRLIQESNQQGSHIFNHEADLLSCDVKSLMQSLVYFVIGQTGLKN